MDEEPVSEAADSGETARHTFLSRNLTTLLLWVIVVVAVVLRVYPWFRANTFLGVQESDDGVYYGASKLLLHGLMPYRDYTIVHPPAVSLLLLPFAITGSAFGDVAGMASARVAVVLVSVVNTLLVYRLASRLPGPHGRQRMAALFAAGLYAVMPNAVIAEHTVLLEPIVNLFCLLAVSTMLRHTPATRSAAAVSGVCCALAVGVKLFACVYVVALVGLLVSSGQRHLLKHFLAGLIGSAVVLFLPFLLGAPAALWHDVVITQISRPLDATSTGLQRIIDMAGLRSVPIALGLTLLATWFLTGVAKARHTSTPFRLWLFIGAFGAIAFTISPSYFPHYGAFLAPAVAMISSYCIVTTDSKSWVEQVGVVAVLALVGVFILGSVQSDVRSVGQGDYKRAHALIEPGSCVFYEVASLAIAADVFSAPTDDCPGWLDAHGVAYTWNTDWRRSQNFYPAGFVGDTRWQAGTLSQLEVADYLLVSRSLNRMDEWAPETRFYALSNFTRILVLPGEGHAYAELWRRMTPADQRPGKQLEGWPWRISYRLFPRPVAAAIHERSHTLTMS